MRSEADVTLRNLKEQDIDELAELANNRNVWVMLRDRFPHPYSTDDARSYIGYALNNESEKIKAVLFKGELAGVIGMIFQDDVYSHVGDLGYWIGEEYWGRGILTSALGLFTKVCQEEYKLKKLEASVFSSNPASMRVLEKSGFSKEGIKRSRIIKDGQLLDEHCYGLII